MSNQKIQPPKWPLHFFRWFCQPEIAEDIEGDLFEKFHRNAEEKGINKAKRTFTWQVILLLRPAIIRNQFNFSENQLPMLRQNLKISWRTLKRNQGFAWINVGGLTIGMTVAMLIGLWIWDELSFNKSFINHERLAQVMLHQSVGERSFTGSTVMMPLGEALRSEYANDFKHVALASKNANHVLSHSAKKLSSKGMWVQADFPEMFSLRMLDGKQDGLNDPSTLLLAESLAKALFGDNDPMHKTIRVDSRFDMAVGGVYEDLPHNTKFHETKLLLPWDNEANWLKEAMTEWMNHCGELYVQLHEHADMTQTSARINKVPTPYFENWKEEALLHPIDKLHLYNQFEYGAVAGGRIQFVWLFGIIGVFVLLLACINFMNLSTAHSENRAREVGIRKTIGSLRSQLVTQFLSESMVMVTVAFVFSLLLLLIAMPPFNLMADKQLSIPWDSCVYWLLCLGFITFTGILAGSYPAFYLSSFKAETALKGIFKAGRFAFLPRKILVVVQFTVSVTLIIGTLFVFKQIQFAKNRFSGYDRDGLISIPLSTPELSKNYEVLRTELLQTQVVKSMAQSSYSPTYFGNSNQVDWKGKDPALVAMFRDVYISRDFGSTIGWTIQAGRDLRHELPGDTTSAIINESAMQMMGFEDPIGEVIQHFGDSYTIVGVVNDMLTQSPYEAPMPSIFVPRGWKSVILIRINKEVPTSDALATIESVFHKHNPVAPFEFSFVDDDYAQKFSSEVRIGKLAAFFSILAIFISLLGLFGLSSFVAEQRKREIGIRKVLGASVTNMWRMLSRDFVLLVFISSFIAIPISYLFMKNWLMQYEYRTLLSWTIFALAIGGALMVTLITVSYQAFKAALANPIKSLRSE